MTSRDAELTAAYRHCKAIAAAHGRTYFLATRLLSAPRRSARARALRLRTRCRRYRRSPRRSGAAGTVPAARLDLIEQRLRCGTDRAPGHDLPVRAGADPPPPRWRSP